MAYVIMLDKDRDSFPNDWAIACQRDSLAQIRQQQQHSGDPLRIPKTSARMELIEPKSLTDAETGHVDSGGIYREWLEG